MRSTATLVRPARMHATNSAIRTNMGFPIYTAPRVKIKYPAKAPIIRKSP